MAKLVDPNSISRSQEIVFDTTNKTIQLLVAGNLDNESPGRTSGVTEQAVYSKCKELWKQDSDLNKLKFPFTAITEVKMDLINTWNWADATTRQLIRDGGWSVNSASIAIDNWMGIVSLGTFVTSSDQAYYQQVASGQSSSFNKSGEVNEAVNIYTGSIVGGFDYRDYFKVFLREQGKLFVQSNLVSEQDLSTLDYTVYKVPLANATDIKISGNDSSITGSNIFASGTIDYLSGSWYNTLVEGGTYNEWDVVFSQSQWYRVSGTAGGTVSTDPFDGSGSGWFLYPGQRKIGDNWYAFDTIITSVPQATESVETIYEWLQYELRQLYDINDNVTGDNYGYVSGSTADLLAAFLGDTLQTKQGVYIDNFSANDTNRIEFFDITVNTTGSTSTARTFPFVSAGTFVFNTVLTGDESASYKVYYTTIGAGAQSGKNYDTVDAIIVNNNAGLPMTGSIYGTSSVTFTYDYDFNAQRAYSGSDAEITVAALGLTSAQWISADFTITKATGLIFPVNAAQERNYSNPV